MKTSIISLICFFLCTKLKAQGPDTLPFGHYSIVKDSPKIIFPKIVSSDFCQKLNSIKIEDSICFVSERGSESFYYISLEIRFGENAKIVSISNSSKSDFLNAIIKKIIELLQKTSWDAPKEKQTMLFVCKLYSNGFKDVSLKDKNNLQRKMICN